MSSGTGLSIEVSCRMPATPGYISTTRFTLKPAGTRERADGPGRPRPAHAAVAERFDARRGEHAEFSRAVLDAPDLEHEVRVAGRPQLAVAQIDESRRAERVARPRAFDE